MASAMRRDRRDRVSVVRRSRMPHPCVRTIESMHPPGTSSDVRRTGARPSDAWMYRMTIVMTLTILTIRLVVAMLTVEPILTLQSVC